jgi:hypothetical protein
MSAGSGTLRGLIGSASVRCDRVGTWVRKPTHVPAGRTRQVQSYSFFDRKTFFIRYLDGIGEGGIRAESDERSESVEA